MEAKCIDCVVHSADLHHAQKVVAFCFMVLCCLYTASFLVYMSRQWKRIVKWWSLVPTINLFLQKLFEHSISSTLCDKQMKYIMNCLNHPKQMKIPNCKKEFSLFIIIIVIIKMALYCRLYTLAHVCNFK